MNATKIRLSPEEIELVMRSDWILTKNRVLQKVWQLLESMQERQQPLLINLPSTIKEVNAKISKGDNYQGLPYLILDQPRYFNKENIFAIREFFWWGHFFSSTLHLSGEQKINYEQQIIDSLDTLKKGGFFICVNTDPWEHHFEENNFVPLMSLPDNKVEEMIRDSSFIKLSKKIPLEKWDSVENELLTIFETYLKILKVD